MVGIRAFSALAVLLCVAWIAPAAGSADSGTPADDSLTVQKIEKQARELVRQQGEMGWRSWALGEPSNQASLYDEYGAIFSRRAIDVVNHALATETDPVRRKALSFLKLYQQTEYVGRETALLEDIYSDLEANLQVNVDGKSVPYRQLFGILSDETDKARRETLASEEYRAYATLNNVVLGRILDRGHGLATELGYDSYADLAVAYRMIDEERNATLCRDFLKKTEAKYLELFDRISPIPRETFRRSDTLFVLGGRDFDKYFPKEDLVERMDAFLNGLGIDRARQANLRLDDRPLPNKVPRAVCFAIDVPGDVRLSIKPVGGKEDYSSLFHEMGHGQHFASSKTDVWEFQQLGSNAVTETYAYLFEYVVEDPLWVRDNTDMDDETLASYTEFCVFVRLYMARRYMAKFLYELELHRGTEDPRARYREIMSQGYGYQLTDEEASRYLSDVDPFLYSADYVQAFFLEAMLRDTLRERFGAKWWNDKGAGAFLRDLFARGNELTGKELAQRLGYPDIQPDALTIHIDRTLGLYGIAEATSH